MRKLFVIAIGLVVTSLALTIQLRAQTSDPAGAAVLEFKTMVTVRRPFVGADNPIRGVPGGGLPWTITDGRGSLKAGGKLEVHVKGLVLADDPAVPANLRLTNPIPFFRGVVSCQIINGSGNPDFVNVSTAAYPADPSGNADIEETLALPSECFAPIIFVTSSGGSWFAMTGR